MMNRGRRISVSLFSIVLLLGFAGLSLVDASPARGAVVNVTTTWNVPTSIAFSVSFPTGLTNITFAPASATFTNEPAQSQSDATAAYRITNDGNVNIDISAVFTTDFPGGVTEFRTATASSSGAPSGTQWWWTDTNETTNSQVIVTALAPSSTADRWAWSTGTNVVGGYSERTYQLTSSAS
jgi:hypothetical protein